MNLRKSTSSDKYHKRSASEMFDQELERKGFATDMGLMKGMIRQLRTGAPNVAVCRHQTRLLVRRLGVIYETLNRIPNPTPSPQLVSVFQCSLFLISKLSPPEASTVPNGAAPLWQQVLKERYVCTTLFGGIRARIRQVWRLQPTDNWEGEDKEAAVKDEEEALIILSDLIKEGSEKAHTDAPEGGNFEKEGDGGVEETPTVSTDWLKHIMRRSDGVSSWKLLFNENITLNRPPLPQGAMGEHRFEVFLGTTFHKHITGSSIGGGCLDVNRSVVVKVLPAKSPAMTPLTMECFVMDLSTRMQWVHPHLIEVYGGFAERLMRGPAPTWNTPTNDPTNTSGGGGVPGVPEVSTAAPVVECSVEEGEFAEAYLGMVIEELPTSLVVNPSGAHRPPSMSSYPAAWCRTERLFSTLDEISSPLSVREAVEVVSQTADALQYCLFDGGDVPSMVRRTWACITPSNVYVRELPAEVRGVASSLSDIVGKLSDLFEVRVFPRIYAEGRPLCRWDPPTSHPHPETYCLSLLLLLLTDGAKPYSRCQSHLDIERSIADPTISPLPDPTTLLLPGGGIDHHVGMMIANSTPELATAMRKTLLWGTTFGNVNVGVVESGQKHIPTLVSLRHLLRDALTDLRLADTDSQDTSLHYHNFGDGRGHLRHGRGGHQSAHDEYGIADAVVASTTIGEPSHVGAA